MDKSQEEIKAEDSRNTIYQESHGHLIAKTVTLEGWRVQLFGKVRECESVAQAIELARQSSELAANPPPLEGQEPLTEETVQ